MLGVPLCVFAMVHYSYPLNGVESVRGTQRKR